MTTRKLRSTAALVAEIEALTAMITKLRQEMTPRSERVDIDAVNGVDFYDIVARFEAQLIGSALELTGGRQNKAARLLNLRKSTLSWKIKKLEEEGKFALRS